MRTEHAALDITEFNKICTQQVLVSDFPLASDCRSNVLCYDANTIRNAFNDTSKKTFETSALKQEIAKILQAGPGVFVIERFFDNLNIIDRHNELFDVLFALQEGQQAADHFAQAGANGRIWNVLQKSALHSPKKYIEYYTNPLFSLVSEAWLGPHYQLTSQVNVVRPGGKAQAPHRDYHLGFQDEAFLINYPPHVHTMSTMLTLQGAVAHTDMPLESGPTLLLPYSHQYPEGYLAWRHDEFKDYFAKHAIQIELKKGDAMFFNPALFHAAGDNTTDDFHRIANLFQVSSAFGRAMETVDRKAMCLAIYPELLKSADSLSALELKTLLDNTCEGYSFPTNLDTDPPLSGMAPQTQKKLMKIALSEQWPLDEFGLKMHNQSSRRLG